jgi:uncharacterized SAM-binding protein YcdF (DUF218 family)
MTDRTYQPFFPTDPEYIRNIKESIKGTGNLEDVHFELLNEALLALGISEDPYEYVTAEGYDTENLENVINEVSAKLAEAPVSPEIETKLYALWDYLCAGDPVGKADVAIVFGGGGASRPILAAELYKEGYAGKLLFTGHSASFMKDGGKTEAELFADIAMENDVPESDIILETKAKNTPENAINSIEILKELGPLPEKIILVQIEYQMLRAYYTFKAVADWDPTLIRQPAPSAKYTRDKFWEDKTALSYVFNEFIKINIARKMGHI